MRLTLILLLTLLSVVSCEKTIDISIPASERKIVLNAIVNADSVFTANIFRSNHLQDDLSKLLYLNNAKIDIYENDEFKETLELDTAGYYKGNTLKAKVGFNYEIRVAVPNLKAVSGKTVLLPVVPVVSFDSTGHVNVPQYWGDEDGSAIIFSTVFKDPKGVKNYYRIKMQSPYVQRIDEISSDISYVEQFYLYGDIHSEDPSIEIDKWIDGYYYFSDVLFDGQEYSFDFVATESSQKPNVEVKDSVYVYLEHISYDFYKYMLGVNMQYDSDDMQLF